MRAVPNKYPLLEPGDPDEAPEAPASGRGDPELLVAGHATGHHEVIVHAPKHVASMSDLDAEQFELAVAGWREACAGACRGGLRARDGQRGTRGGRVAGHSHAQLYALDFVPALIARERERFTAHNTRTMGVA